MRRNVLPMDNFCRPEIIWNVPFPWGIFGVGIQISNFHFFFKEIFVFVSELYFGPWVISIFIF